MSGSARSYLAAWAVLCALASSGWAQSIDFKKLSPESIESRLREVPANNPDRREHLKFMFMNAGCVKLQEQPVEGSRLPNLTCTLPGETASIIVVGAHYDHSGPGSGAVDNWSGASLLPTLFLSINRQTRKHTFVFATFADEENGQAGSRALVKKFTAEKAPVAAMIDLNSLGLGSTVVSPTQSEPAMVEAMAAVAKAMDLEVRTAGEKIGPTASESFLGAGIPSIAIHSVTKETLPVLHSAKDTLEAVKLDDYYETYQLIAGYLCYVDEAKLPAPKKKHKKFLIH